MHATPVAVAVPVHPLALHPLHAALLAGTVPLFLGALLSDLAYWQSYEIQWNNFASWLIVGGLVVGAPVLAWSLLALLRARHRRGGAVLQALLVLAMWLLALFNALVHARDAWASMPAGLVLSVLVALLALAATAVGFRRPRGAWT